MSANPPAHLDRLTLTLKATVALENLLQGNQDAARTLVDRMPAEFRHELSGAAIKLAQLTA